MAQYKNTFDIDLVEKNGPVNLRSMVCQANNAANVIAVRVFENGESVQLAGTCVGRILRADGKTVVLNGTISGNTASITLDSQCYAVVGFVAISINWVSGDKVTTLLKAHGYVEKIQTETLIAGESLPSYDEMLALVEQLSAENVFRADTTIIAGDGTVSSIADHNNVQQNTMYRMQLTTKMSWLPSEYPTTGAIYYLIDISHPYNGSYGVAELIMDEAAQLRWVRTQQPGGSFSAWRKYVSGRCQIECNPGTNTIQNAVDTAMWLRDADVILKPGTYSITNFSGNGMSIGNGVRVLGHPDAVISAINSGTSQYFSPFYAGEGDYELNGVKLVCKNVRYCVHDDPPSAVSGTPARHKFINCDMYIDNTGNTGWTNHQCIGGGLGRHTIINIENCHFEAADPQSNLGLVSYHNNGASDAEGMIFIKDSMFVGDEGTARFGWYGQSQKITKCFVVGCAMGHAPVIRAETTDSSSPYQNMELITWNSGVAQNTYGAPVDVINSVSSTSTTDALSANMGRYIYGLANTALEELNNGGVKRIPLPDSVTDLNNTNFSDYDQHFYISETKMAGSLAHKPFNEEIPAILDVYKLTTAGEYIRQVLTAYDDGTNDFNRVYVRQKYYNNGSIVWSDWESANSGGGVTVVDNLNSTSATSALSANQGRALNEIIQNGGVRRITLQSNITSLNNVVYSDIDHHYYIPQAKMNTITNAPFNAEIPAILDVYKIDADGVYIRQVLTAYDDGTYRFNRIYARQKYYTSSGSVWGAWKLIGNEMQTENVPSNSDLNNYIKPGIYGNSTNSGGQTIANNPTKGAFLLEVMMLQASLDGNWLAGIQRVTSYDGAVTYTRHIGTNGSGEWGFSAWYKQMGTVVS